MIYRAVFADYLAISGSNVYNLFQNSKELAYYLCTDKINDLLLLNIDEKDRVTPVLACNDRVLRILDVRSFIQSRHSNLPSFEYYRVVC